MFRKHLLVTIPSIVALVLAIATAPAIADPTPAFEAMAEAGAAYVNDPARCPGVISAQALFADLDSYTVVDLRNHNDYINGHIPGAYGSSLATLLDDLATSIPAHQPYVITCYTGQTSGIAKIAMELTGHTPVYSLNFGMAGWNRSLSAPWNVHVGDLLADPETANQNGDLTVHEFPALDGDPATIVAERVATVLAGGVRAVYFASIQDHLDDYFIINYFGEADYLGQGTSGCPGHIPGAFQFTPYQSLGIDQMLASIPPDQTVVVYGWTGQHSSQLVAYLDMLGYDAYNLLFGANSLFWSDLTAHCWSADIAREYPLDTGSGPTAVTDLGAAPIADLANHPNPFNPATTITYRLAEPSTVTLRIHDLRGRLVRELLPGVKQAAGARAVIWLGEDDAGRTVPSGIYLCRLEAGGQMLTRRLALVQ